MTTETPILEVKNLDKTFTLHLLDGREIYPVKQVNFTARTGKTLVIRGRSGAGKTTILKCIYRTYLPSAGEMWFESQELGRINLAAAEEKEVLRLREREIGYCSQFLKVLPRVAAWDVIAEPLVKTGMAREEAREKASQWLKRLGIEESRWQAYPVTFSGGEQQRVNLARAFISAPRLLLLDEPTASLDHAAKEMALELINNAKAQGVAVLVVSHDNETLSSLADETYWMEG